MKTAEMSADLIDYMGSDLTTVNAARVSFNKTSDWEIKGTGVDALSGLANTSLSEADQKLIRYLGKHNHWSPFAHNQLQFRIKAPIFVARQLVKHQVGLVWNEVSRRYVDDEPEFWFPKVWRGKPVNAKQGSSGECPSPRYWDHTIQEICADALNCYLEAIEEGMAPEQARMWLPQNTMTEWWWTGSLMAFARVCTLRLDPHAQEETRQVAQMINDQIPKEFEHSWKALMQ